MSGGSIQIHSPATCRELRLLEADREDLAQEPAAASRVVMTSPRQSSSRDMVRKASCEIGRLSRTVSRDTGRLSRLSSAAQMANVQSWLTHKARRAVVALPEPPELGEVEEMCESLLQQERELVSELESALCSHAREEENKRELLFHKWSRRVFAPLHSHITMTMGGSQYQNLDREERALFQRYLNYCNTKSVFLDTVSADEYDPLCLRDQHTQLTAETGTLHDPLLTQQNDRDTEQRIIFGIHGNKCGSAGTHRSVSRVGVAMDAVSWLAIQLMYVDSDVRQRSRRRVQRDHNEMQGVGDGVGELCLPHKTPTSLHHPPLSLTWPNS